MRLLLDTHVLLWRAIAERLVPAATEALMDIRNDLFVSAASIWEAEIKAVAGRLDLGLDLAEGARERGCAELPVTFAHAVEAARLPPHHADPFDRMLIAQARIEGLTVVTRDAAFTAYDVPVLPA